MLRRISFSLFVVLVMLLVIPIHQSQAQSAKVTTAIRQNQVAVFPGVGKVRIQVFEEQSEGTTSKLVITQATTRQPLFTFPGPYEVLRFRLLTVAGLPAPLLLAVAISPGGSDHSFVMTIISVSNGEFKILTEALAALPDKEITDSEKQTAPPVGEFNPLHTSIQGGVFVGNLGKELGPGIAVWQFLWEDGAHYDRHRYEIRLCPFDRATGQFKEARILQSRRKHPSDKGALAELGLKHYRNLLDDFPAIRDYRE